MGDTVAVGGWDLSAYKRNPVVLFAHDSSSPPVGRANRVWSDGTRLLGDVEFADKETYDFADTIYRLIKGGFLKSGSVGFLPTEYRFSERAAGGIDYRSQELLEFSIVPVPANANALTEARMKGILSIRDARRLRRAAEDDPMPSPAIGNCGRPLQEECGLKNKDECATHRQQGDEDGDDEEVQRRVRRLVARARSDLLNAPIRMPTDTKAQRLLYLQRLRERHGLKRVDPRIVAADCAFRFRVW
jgi:HK97 family phage prohead protease